MTEPTWISLTKLFPPNDMALLQTATTDELYSELIRENPVIAMRMLTELRLHDDTSRLPALLSDPILTTHWLEWALDRQLLDADEGWAKALLAKK